jgi:site-specific recombinase XerD
MDVSTEQTMVYNTQALNERIIADYIQARKTETNLAESTQRVMTDNLNRFSKYLKKDFKDITRDDLISFLNSLRKTEIQDSNHQWIGTYNLYLVTISTFFKWFFYPKIEPKQRPKPGVVQNLKQLKRKEKSAYKPTDMWTHEDDLLFLKYCPPKEIELIIQSLGIHHADLMNY